MTTETALYARTIGLVAGGAVFWLYYFDLKDRLQPEPRRLLSLAFFLGGVAAVLGLGLYRSAELLGAPDHPDGGPGAILAYCLLLVGPIEEGAKFAVARAVVFRWRAFDEPIDGLIYAGALAIGFASFENLLYVPLLDWPAQIARALASPLTHSLFAAVWGYGAGQARFAARTRVARAAWQWGTLLAAMALHGIYDFVLLAYAAPWLGALIALALWLPLIVVARRWGHAGS